MASAQRRSSLWYRPQAECELRGAVLFLPATIVSALQTIPRCQMRPTPGAMLTRAPNDTPVTHDIPARVGM